jgi:DNA repair photolyase
MMPMKSVAGSHCGPARGRAATANPEGRFERVVHQPCDDGWFVEEAPQRQLRTVVTEERVKSIIAHNQSPDVPFERSINPYRGCEHGCIYCYARPTHGYLGLSPGLDFETRLVAKVNAAQVLEAELAKPGYRPDVIALGANTDPYQPIERRLRITRALIEVLARCEHPLVIVTKNALVERDIDLLAAMSQRGLVRVYLSVNSLDHEIARRLEPRCSAPARRLQAMRRLSDAGVAVGVLVAPVIPFLTDDQIEAVLQAAWDAGARHASYVLLRLPYEVKDLFRAWLNEHFPLKADHVMSRVHAMREGRANDPQFGTRMRGTGELAQLLRLRFELACRRLGFNDKRRYQDLDCSRFRPPRLGGQLALF